MTMIERWLNHMGVPEKHHQPFILFGLVVVLAVLRLGHAFYLMVTGQS